MARVVTYGRMPDTMPPGNFTKIRFPNAASLDEGTQEGWISRKLSSDGGRSLDLPRTISFQYQDDAGHLRSVPVGSLHEVTIDGEGGMVSMSGFLTDTPDGRLAGHLVWTQAMHRSSLDIADVPADGVKITEHGDFWDDDFTMEVEFTDWAVGKNTLVAMPAFKNTMSEVEIEEALTAALGPDGELVVTCPSYFSSGSAVEVMASMSTRPSWDHFHVPEPDIPCPIVVDEPDKHGWIPIYGNLAQWRKQHRDSMGVLRHPPRGYDGYANFMKPKGVLTDKGFVACGPITLLGGHVTLKDAAEKVENVWADVRVIDGKHGPWISGVMRPHIAADEVATYRARASQISGYWSGGVLRLISSVTTPGYPVTASEDQDALVASFSPDPPERGRFPLEDVLSFDEIKPEAQARLRAWVEAGARSMSSEAVPIDISTPAEPVIVGTTEAELTAEVDDDDFAFRQRQRERALELEAEGV